MKYYLRGLTTTSFFVKNYLLFLMPTIRVVNDHDFHSEKIFGLSVIYTRGRSNQSFNFCNLVITIKILKNLKKIENFQHKYLINKIQF